MKAIGITDQQVANFIIGYRDSHGYPPTVREIADEHGCAVSAAHYVLRRMVKEGIITVAPGSPRAINVIGSVMKEVTVDG